MQTSNKIIIAFLTFAWLSIIASLLISSGFVSKLLISSGLGSITLNRYKTDLRNETTVLQDFSVIYIKEASNLRVFSGDTNQLEYDEISGVHIKPPKTVAIQDFVVRNDTLLIRNLRNASNGGYTLRVRNLKQLIVSNTSNIELMGFNQDSLMITVEDTNTLLVNNSDLSYVHFVSPEKFDLEILSANDLGVSLFGKNHFSVDGNIQEISGKIGNYMELNVPRKTEIVNVDTSENGKLTYSDPKEVDQGEH